MRESEIKGGQQSEAYFLILICHEWAVQVPRTVLCLKNEKQKKKKKV